MGADAKHFFDPWTCKPNEWECKIGIASKNISFSIEKSSNILPKSKCEAENEKGMAEPCIPNQNIIEHCKLKGVQSTINVTCFWGGKTCAKWTNQLVKQQGCDDPKLGS